jgi:hypothetical protein
MRVTPAQVEPAWIMKSSHLAVSAHCSAAIGARALSVFLRAQRVAFPINECRIGSYGLIARLVGWSNGNLSQAAIVKRSDDRA